MLDTSERSSVTTYKKFDKPNNNELIFYYCILSSVLYVYNVK